MNRTEVHHEHRRTQAAPLARNVRRLGHLDLPGAGQVCGRGPPRLCRAHPEQEPARHLDRRHCPIRATRAWSRPSRSTITTSHSHKARVVGDIMIVNHERNLTAIGRRADELPRVRAGARRRARARADPRRDRRQAERDRGRRRRDRGGGQARLSQRRLQDLRRVEARAAEGDRASARPAASACTASTWTSATPTSRPRWRAMSATSWSSTTSRDPQRPQEVSRWWMPGQHVAGGETPTWPGRQHRLHHALRFGNEMWASCWHGGFWIVDVSDLPKPKSARHLQLSPAVSGADAHRDAGAGAASAAGASRSRSTRRTRRRARTRRRRGAGARMPAS